MLRAKIPGNRLYLHSHKRIPNIHHQRCRPALCQVPVFEGKETYPFPKGKCPFSLENSCYSVLCDVYRKLETFSLSCIHTMSYSFRPILHLKDHDFTKMSTCSFIKKSSIPKMVVFIKSCFSFLGSRAARSGHSFCREAQGQLMRGVHRCNVCPLHECPHERAQLCVQKKDSTL